MVHMKDMFRNQDNMIFKWQLTTKNSFHTVFKTSIGSPECEGHMSCVMRSIRTLLWLTIALTISILKSLQDKQSRECKVRQT